MAKKEKITKTTVMRILEQHKCPYQPYAFDFESGMTAVDMANLLHRAPESVFKTLVTTGATGAHYVFVLPASASLALKKAAQCVGEKSVEMVHQKDLLSISGYIHGGCSPIGMKKSFRTVIDKSAENWETIVFSAGHVGVMVEIPVSRLHDVLDFEYGDIADIAD